ncbi:MAG: tetratricopeptide repeat protein [Vicinamibacterales bacterium]
MAVVLLAINWFIYSAVGGFDFVNWDDPTYVLDNPRVLDGLSWSNVQWAFTTNHPPYWHPLTWLSHMLDVSLWGRDAGAHHLVNLWFHIVNSWLVFAIFRYTTYTFWPSAFIAAVFAAHPLHVESVAWVAERKDVLSACFMLMALLAYAIYARVGQPWHYAACLTAFALALMAKPMAVTLPALLLALDVWPLKRVKWTSGLRDWGLRLLEKLPMFAMAAAAAVITIIRQSEMGAMASLEALSLSARAVNALVGYAWYLALIFWPAGLVAFHPIRIWPSTVVMTSLLVLVLVSAAALRFRREHPYLLTGWLFFLIALAPVSGVFQAGEQAIAERFVYLPMLGIVMAVTWAVVESGWPQRLMPKFLPLAAGGIVVALTVSARAQVPVWSDSLTLWVHALEARGESTRAYEKLAEAQRERGDLASALLNYQRALDLSPKNAFRYHAVVRNAMGLTASRRGDFGLAVQHLLLSVQADEGFAEAQLNLGNALAASGNHAEAEKQFRVAVQLNPNLTEAHLGLGGAVLRQGRAAEAQRYYEAAIELQPDLAEAHNGLGAALMVDGQVDEAIPQLREAVRLKPGLATAHLNLGMALLRKGDAVGARKELEQALSLDAGLVTARNLLNSMEPVRRD